MVLDTGLAFNVDDGGGGGGENVERGNGEESSEGYEEWVEGKYGGGDGMERVEEKEEKILEHRNPELQKAVIRVEDMMREMVESGVKPDLHSFMAGLFAFYEKKNKKNAALLYTDPQQLTPPRF